MPAWKTRLHPNEVVLMAAYVAGLRGKNLKGRPPEGEKIDPWPRLRSSSFGPPIAQSHENHEIHESASDFQSARTRWPRPFHADGRRLAVLAPSAACLGTLPAGEADAGLALIAVFTLLPYLKIHGKPAVLLDLPDREFTIFGFTFLSTDTLLAGPGADHADLGHLPGDGPGRPHVVRLDVSADGLPGIRFPAASSGFSTVRPGPSIARAGNARRRARWPNMPSIWSFPSIWPTLSWPTSSASRPWPNGSAVRRWSIPYRSS